MSILGIDLGSDTIKVVELAKARGGFKLVNYGITPTPPDAVVEGDVVDPEMVGEALGQLLKMNKFKSKQAVVSVQGQKSTVVRIIELPRMSQKELAETMQFEVERHIPFPASQIIMDYKAIARPGEANDTPNMEVLFGVVQEQVVTVLIEALRIAKVKPVAIDVQPLALSRALVEAPSPGAGVGETVALVNMGAQITELSIIRDGLLQFPRTIPLAGRSVTQRLSEGLGISEHQAERQKREHASVRPLPAGAVPTPAPTPAAAPEETKAPEVPSGLDFGDEFGSDIGDDSDTGFGGSGMDFGQLAPGSDEDDEPTPFVLSDEDGDDGPSFDFGFSDDDSETKFSLAPPDDDDEAVPDEDSFSFSFDDDATGEKSTEETLEGPAFELDLDEDSTAPQAPELGAADETGDEDSAAEFNFELTETETDEPAGGAAELGFDFSVDDSDTGSTIPGAAAASGATDVGSSFDLGDLASDDGSFDFDLGEISEDTEEGTAGTPAPPPAAGDEAQQVRQVIEPVLREIAGEIGRSLDYYRSRFEGTVIDRVVLVGGSSKIDGLTEFLEAELGLPVDLGDPLAALTVANPRLTDEDLARDASLLAVAVGLAMVELM